MALDTQVFPAQPYSVEFMRWASDLTEQLASYNVPNPDNEDSWQFWAAQVASIPEVAELGVQDPSAFVTWQDWGASLLQVL